MPTHVLEPAKLSLVAAGLLCLVTAVAAEELPAAESSKPMEPARRSQRGDYDIEHFQVAKGDALKFPSGYVYEVIEVEPRQLVLRAAPEQEGVGNKSWKIPAGRSPIGNHNKIVVSNLNADAQTANVSIEHKKRWHWWDGFNF
jgi:hypothetical protein